MMSDIDHQKNEDGESPATYSSPGYLSVGPGLDFCRFTPQWSHGLLATHLTQMLQVGMLATGSKLIDPLSSEATIYEPTSPDIAAVLGAFFLVLRNPQILPPVVKQQE